MAKLIFQENQQHFNNIVARAWVERQLLDQAMAHCGDSLSLLSVLQNYGYLTEEQVKILNSLGTEAENLTLANLKPGFQFRQYLLETELSRGAMGAIFAAKDTQVARDVAIKVNLLPRNDTTLSLRFQREAEALAKLRHKNVVRVHESGQLGQIQFIVMERIHGQDLESIINTKGSVKSEGLELKFVLETFLDLVHTLISCRNQGIAHRDLKPQNIMIEAKTERAILVDFGLAKLTAEKNSESATLTNAGEVLGTPKFMAPEQMDPGRIDESKYTALQISTASDVWGLASVLYFALTGEYAHRGSDFVSLYQQKLSQDSVNFKGDWPNFPPLLEELLRRCLTTEIEPRASLEEFSGRLSELLGKTDSDHVSQSFEVELHRDELKSKSVFYFAALSAISLIVALLLCYSYFIQKPTVHRNSKPLGDLQPKYFTQFDNYLLKFKTDFAGTVSIAPASAARIPLKSKISRVGQLVSFPLKLKHERSQFIVGFKQDSMNATRSIEVVLDQQAPKVELSDKAGFQVAEDTFVAIAEADGHVTVKVSDLSPVKAVKDGKSLKVSESGVLEISSDNLGQLDLKDAILDRSQFDTIRLKDSVQLSYEFRLAILKQKDVTAIRSAFQSFEAWSQLTAGQRSVISDFVVAKIPDIEVKRPISTQVKKFNLSLLQFRHKRTGIDFLLIPGSVQWLGTKDMVAEQHYCATTEKAWKAHWTIDMEHQEFRCQPMLVAVDEVSIGQWNRGLKIPSASKEKAIIAKNSIILKDVFAWIKTSLPSPFADLPTDKEWESFCRAGAPTRYYYGDEFLNPHSSSPAIIKKILHPLRLRNLQSGVSEWTRTASNDFSNFVRGAANFDHIPVSRSAHRQSRSRAAKQQSIGFRPVLRISTAPF